MHHASMGRKWAETFWKYRKPTAESQSGEDYAKDPLLFTLFFAKPLLLCAFAVAVKAFFTKTERVTRTGLSIRGFNHIRDHHEKS